MLAAPLARFVLIGFWIAFEHGLEDLRRLQGHVCRVCLSPALVSRFDGIMLASIQYL
jgi:hypothetical protein